MAKSHTLQGYTSNREERRAARGDRPENLVFGVVTSILLHSILFLGSDYWLRAFAPKQELSEPIPIEYVEIPPNETKTPPETSRRAAKDSVAGGKAKLERPLSTAKSPSPSAPKASAASEPSEVFLPEQTQQKAGSPNLPPQKLQPKPAKIAVAPTTKQPEPPLQTAVAPTAKPPEPPLQTAVAPTAKPPEPPLQTAVTPTPKPPEPPLQTAVTPTPKPPEPQPSPTAVAPTTKPLAFKLRQRVATPSTPPEPPLQTAVTPTPKPPQPQPSPTAVAPTTKPLAFKLRQRAATPSTPPEPPLQTAVTPTAKPPEPQPLPTAVAPTTKPLAFKLRQRAATPSTPPEPPLQTAVTPTAKPPEPQPLPTAVAPTTKPLAFKPQQTTVAPTTKPPEPPLQTAIAPTPKSPEPQPSPTAVVPTTKPLALKPQQTTVAPTTKPPAVKPRQTAAAPTTKPPAPLTRQGNRNRLAAKSSPEQLENRTTSQSSPGARRLSPSPSQGQRTTSRKLSRVQPSSKSGGASRLGGPVSLSNRDFGTSNLAALPNSNRLNQSVDGIDARQDADLGPYLQQLQEQVRQHWIPGLTQSSRRTVLQFTVSRAGLVSNLRIAQTSGLSVTDEAAVSAVKRAVPFSPLPTTYTENYINIQFTFNINVYGELELWRGGQ